MNFKFKYELKQNVTVKDHSEERNIHKGVVTRRWLEENPPYMENKGILERYDVMLLPNFQVGEFFVEDLQSV